MDGSLLLDVIVGENAGLVELLPCENESLLVAWDAFLVLNLSLDSLDGVLGLDIKGDGLASKGLNEDLHELCCACGKSWLLCFIIELIIIPKLFK